MDEVGVLGVLTWSNDQVILKKGRWALLVVGLGCLLDHGVIRWDWSGLLLCLD